MSEYRIPLSLEDEYILQTFDNTRCLRRFNSNLRGITVPVGAFNNNRHEHVVFDVSSKDKPYISQLANQFQMEGKRYDARVLYVEWCEKENQYIAGVEWLDRKEVPDNLRITAVMRGRACVRVLQFGVE